MPNNHVCQIFFKAIQIQQAYYLRFPLWCKFRLCCFLFLRIAVFRVFWRNVLHPSSYLATPSSLRTLQGPLSLLTWCSSLVALVSTLSCSPFLLVQTKLHLLPSLPMSLINHSSCAPWFEPFLNPVWTASILTSLILTTKDEGIMFL